MKVILSRKGFDSENGGYPSPILPNGQMISLPIPDQKDDIRYSDVKVGDLAYYDLMKALNPRIKSGNKRLGIDEDTRCHLDPDIYKKAVGREPKWKPLFGQAGAAQGHLRKQEVSEDDLFLFFGWFRKTRYDDGKLVFDSCETDMHVLFGYLQIETIKKVDHSFDVPKWMEYHPHIKSRNGSIYIARPKLSWNESFPGAGRFMFSNQLVLTKKGHSKSKWDLPECFKDAEISYHKHPWKDGYFRSVGKGQEFVIKDNERIEDWARNKIEGSQIDY